MRDLRIALQRIESAVHFFGGIMSPIQTCQRNIGNPQNIFRLTSRQRQRREYELILPRRYCLDGARISWELEDNPPIVVDTTAFTDVKYKAVSSKIAINATRSIEVGINQTVESTKQDLHKKIKQFAKSDSRSKESYPVSCKALNVSMTNRNIPKYRCTRCGKPKQNHTCVVEESQERNIGVMVYPIANAYTADEPGLVAPSLTTMNNFCSYDTDPANEVGENIIAQRCTRPGMYLPPDSTGENRSAFPAKTITPDQQQMQHQEHQSIVQSKSFTVNGRSNFIHSSIRLQPEQYRTVTNIDLNDGDDSSMYQYTAIPLTYTERQRLNDTLFYLIRNDIPSLLDDCTMMLRDLGEVINSRGGGINRSSEWDLAVSELLTQVIVGLYCWEGDFQLDGLAHYLLSNGGIAC
jgi:hypothetical protein